MAKSNERFLHGEHNEKVCEVISLQKSFPDWAITTAFYAALHFVSYKIFPFTHTVSSGHSVKFENIEQWQQFKSYTSNKRHELLKELVAVHCEKISPDYDWLLSLSMTARYHQYQQDELLADKAIRLMKTIKKACQPDEP